MGEGMEGRGGLNELYRAKWMEKCSTMSTAELEQLLVEKDALIRQRDEAAKIDPRKNHRIDADTEAKCIRRTLEVRKEA